MGLLKELENKLEKLVDGMFAGKFQTSVEPIEIANQLRKVMVDNKKLSINSYYVPSTYIVDLSPDDHAQLEMLGSKLIDELEKYLLKEAMDQGFEPISKIRISLVSNEHTTKGKFQVSVEITSPAPDKTHADNNDKTIAYLEIDGQDKSVPIIDEVSTLGRALENEIYLPYEKISRNHAKITLQDGGFIIEDLNSTNGTFINDKKITRQFVPFGKRLKIADLIVCIRSNIA